MEHNCINKIVITEEAKFDYEEMTSQTKLPCDIKSELEEYINNFIGKKHIGYYRYYFRVKYYDENIDKMLMLFIYKGQIFGKMQLWELAGVCDETDWSEEFEEFGLIRCWLNTKIVDLPDEEDWVVRLRKWKEEGRAYQETFNIAGIRKEVINEIQYGGNTSNSNQLPFYRNANKKWYGKWSDKRKS